MEEYSFGDDWVRNDGSYDVAYMKAENESFRFSGFPDIANSYKFITYWSNNSNISIFGIHIGDNYSEANSILRKYHYRILEKDDNSVEYKKGRVTLSFNLQHEIVEMIYIDLKQTDWLHKGYYK